MAHLVSDFLPPRKVIKMDKSVKYVEVDHKKPVDLREQVIAIVKETCGHHSGHLFALTKINQLFDEQPGQKDGTNYHLRVLLDEATRIIQRVKEYV